MAGILIVGADAGGNVPPAVAIANELVRRGHDVALAGHGPRARADLANDAELLPLNALGGTDVARATGTLRQMRALGRLGTSKPLAREVAALIDARRPGAVVIDVVMMSSLQAALATGVPAAALFHTLGAFMLKSARPPLSQLARAFGMPTVTLLTRARARILPTDPELDPAHGGEASIAFDWVGTTEPGTPPAPRVPTEPPLVLVSLSSAWAARQTEVYRRVIHALAELPVRAIVTTGGAPLDGKLEPAVNVEVRERMPHVDLLPHVDLVIGHGGHSTTLKTLAHGVPLLVIPVNPLSDQALMGRVVEEHGLGRTLPPSASVARIRDTAAAMLADRVLRDVAARNGERLRAQDGASAAADLIESRCLASAAAP